MNTLFSLGPTAARLLTPEFVHGSRGTLDDAEWTPLTTALLRAVSLDAVGAVLSEAIERFVPFEVAIDGFLSPRLHRALKLTTREAADPGLFRFLAMVAFPRSVRHRWLATSFTQARARFWQQGARPDSNAFSRWWWIAELSRDGDDYTMTERVFSNSSLCTNVFIRSTSGARAFVHACVEVLADAEGPLIEATMKDFQRLLGTVPVEAMSRVDIANELRALRRRQR